MVACSVGPVLMNPLDLFATMKSEKKAKRVQTPKQSMRIGTCLPGAIDLKNPSISVAFEHCPTNIEKRTATMRAQAKAHAERYDRSIKQPSDVPSSS
eukprot:CAMPEP_0173412740 /NCGR_PEP_ID=MMETSP1356-20130122/80274_1 /TAXON_ID=77927 ORGANISM="Hemiselmis virescens, Strain PCC157" /NCGR_SAMPLE_ID=MMETSP1356 /ASSEMBLY_ACC=CAM_ASM_000847 /LENGTH=96 /DNA_ID=CAMNT_0014374675 /DNA_START=1 /DNA_END=291 /DNA_ORIENTATION=+